MRFKIHKKCFEFKWKGVFTSIMLFRIFVNYKSLVNLFFIFYSMLQLNFKNVDRLRPTKVYQPPMSDCDRNWNRVISKKKCFWIYIKFLNTWIKNVILMQFVFFFFHSFIYFILFLQRVKVSNIGILYWFILMNIK